MNLLLVVLVCRLTSMQNIKHREYSKNMEIVQICHKRLFLKRGRRYLTEKYGNDKKLGGGGCFWKSPTGIEVLLWSSNPVFNVGGGQARGGNEISNLEHKTGKLWPGKKEIMETRKMFSFHFLHYIPAWRPPALFFSRRFMTESSRFKGWSPSGQGDTQGHSTSRTNQRI